MGKTGYRTERVSPSRTLKAIVENVRNFDDIDRLPCPYCNEQMTRVDNGDYPFEEYKDARFERTEKFYCENCYTWADVTQVYRQEERRMNVMRDIWEEER